MVLVKTNVPEDSPWYKSKYWPKDVPHQLEYDDEKTMYDLLEDNAKEVPDWNALWFLESWVTYKELKDYVDRFASGLLQIGVKQGDVIALILPNSIQYVVSYYAAIKIGAIVTGVNPTYKPAEVLHQLHECNVKYAIILDSLNETMLQPIRDKANLKAVISTNIADLATGISSFKKVLGKLLGKIPKGKVPDSYKFLDLLKASPNSERAKFNQDDTAVLMMTGGTTGVPKAAILTHKNIYTNTLQCLLWLTRQKASPDDPTIGPKTGMVGVLPLFHSFAMTTVMNSGIAAKGWQMLFPKPPKTEELLETFNELPAPNGLIYCAAEILFQRIADLEDIEPYREGISKLKLCISGAGPLHRPIQERFEAKTGAKITEGYGLAEASPVVCAGNFFGPRKIGSIGMPFPGTEWKIFPADDFSKGPIEGFGEENTGEICVVGPQVMKGYLNRPEQTADTLKEYDGKIWLLTGDIGFMDEDGMITIRDRKKQLIKMKGYSIYPKEVESLVGQHPDVLEVAVAGIPDPETGELVKAWVKIKEGSTLTPEELREWCKQNMTHYKVPKEIEFRDEIPKSMVGKVMRRVLQEEDPRYQAKMKEMKK
ncbi:MAG: AMP-binding protein [Promethearchaeota archaeon]